MTSAPKTSDPKLVYVITDLDPKPDPTTSSWSTIREVLRPTLLMSVVAAPLLPGPPSGWRSSARRV